VVGIARGDADRFEGKCEYKLVAAPVIGKCDHGRRARRITTLGKELGRVVFESGGFCVAILGDRPRGKRVCVRATWLGHERVVSHEYVIGCGIDEGRRLTSSLTACGREWNWKYSRSARVATVIDGDEFDEREIANDGSPFFLNRLAGAIAGSCLDEGTISGSVVEFRIVFR
jgi:hypothetical protein